MAMNKAERAEMQALQDQLALAKAWRLTDPVEPDIAPPQSGEPDTKGWHVHAYLGGLDLPVRVERATSSVSSHFVGENAWVRRRDFMSNSQGSRPLYSTKTRALRAGRYQIEQQMLRKLAQIDQQIAAAEAEEKANG